MVPLTTPAVTFGLTVNTFDADTDPLQPLTVYVIVDVPALTAVTNPVAGFTVATPGALLLHVPPPVPLLV